MFLYSLCQFSLRLRSSLPCLEWCTRLHRHTKLCCWDLARCWGPRNYGNQVCCQGSDSSSSWCSTNAVGWGHGGNGMACRILIWIRSLLSAAWNYRALDLLVGCVFSREVWRRVLGAFGLAYLMTCQQPHSSLWWLASKKQVPKLRVAVPMAIFPRYVGYYSLQLEHHSECYFQSEGRWAGSRHQCRPWVFGGLGRKKIGGLYTYM